jgi:hypothetical protein
MTPGEAMVAAVADYVRRALAPITTRLATMEVRVGALSMMTMRGADGARLAELENLVREVEALRMKVKTLEERGTLRYMGVWKDGVGYEQGAFVTHAGSMWHADETTVSKPGTCSAWTLCVKRGSNGKDAAHE